jgi:hypothetical protein
MVGFMKDRVLSMATALAGAWTTLYTAGMPAAIRRTRRNEIASDLWEYCAEVTHGDRSHKHAAAEILLRLFLGMPDDIFWRWETQVNTTTAQGEMPRWLNATELGLPLSAVVLYVAASFSSGLNDTAVAIAIRESAFWFPAILTIHIVSICAFIGFATMVDLRVLGWTLKRTPVLEVGESLLPLAMGGFAVVLFSGGFIYLADAVRYSHNTFFNLKVLLLFVGGLNAWITHRRVFKRSHEWSEAGSIPARDRMAAGLSLLFWGLLIVSSRLTAFSA